MRQKIGLVVELPRHGPGVKEHMYGIEERLLEPARVSLFINIVKHIETHFLGAIHVCKQTPW